METRRILLLLFVLPLALAQFPAVCNRDVNINSKICCPNNCAPNGDCVNITETVERSWMSADAKIGDKVRDMVPADVRYQWPLRVFEMVCVCNPGWGGYDCSHCDFGYITAADGSCVKQNENQLPVRRNFLDLNTQEQDDYISVLRRAKNEPIKKWSVVVREPIDDSGTVTLQDVSTYDMLVVHHFIATREKDNKNCESVRPPIEIDFAHESSTFLTWHRYYLLIVERELRRIAADLNITNFALAYWDWTPNNASLFSVDLFGRPEFSYTPTNVTWALSATEWPVVCDKHYKAYLYDRGLGNEVANDCATVRTLCDVQRDRANNQTLQLQRGRICDKTPFLPDDNSILMALTASQYYNSNKSGFNRRVEGFVELCAGEVRRCMFTDLDGVHNNLHNAVHIYLGGHMRVVPSASNDPIFFLHHANIDRIFEAWLRKFNGNPPPYMPISGGHPGHNLNDSLVPFFPLKTNADMYKISSALGFRYDTLPWNTSGSDDGPCPSLTANTCSKGGYSPSPSAAPSTCSNMSDASPSPTTGGTTSRPTSGGGGTSPDAGTTSFHVPLHLILITGTCAVLTVFKLFSI